MEKKTNKQKVQSVLKNKYKALIFWLYKISALGQISRKTLRFWEGEYSEVVKLS